MDSDEIPPAQAESAPPPVPVPPRGRRFGRRARIATLVVAVAALIAGVIVWAPWMPNPPTAVRAASPTATTAVISWTASGGAFGPDHYLVLRDGRQVGQVPASATSYTDHGLAPGRTYHYTVIAAGLASSGPSAKATVRAATPSPVGLATSQVTHTTLKLNWSAPPNAPIPDHYVIHDGSTIVTTVPGTTTSYSVTGMPAGASFRYYVVAQWDSGSSKPSAVAGGQTLEPPLPLSFGVHVRYVSLPGNGWTDPKPLSWTDDWSADAVCNAGSCHLTISLSLLPPDGSLYQQVTVSMHPSGSGGAYTGSAKEQVTTCGPPKSQTVETDTFTLNMRPRGSVRNGAWVAWSGTVVLNAPLQNVAGGFCPPATWTLDLTSHAE